MNYRIIISLFALFSFISIGMIWHTKNIQDNVVKTSGLNNAKLYSDAITAFRTIYTSEVVSVARQHGLQVTHDYENKAAIPLPATLSILLGNKIAEGNSGARAILHSPYPFPWRQETGGLKDDFSKRAWEHLSNNADKPYFEFYLGSKQKLLRYATADLMRVDCIDCHNTHPDSPKTDWRVGDIRGIVDITIPLDSVITKTNNDLLFTIFIYSILALLGVFGIIFMLAKHKAEADNLEREVESRTALLEEEKVRAITASRAKSLFLSKMNHELRTPMNAILGFGQLLATEASTKEEKENAKEIVIAGNHLLDLINDLLDLETMESGGINVDITSVSLDPLISETLHQFESTADNNNVHIKDYKPSGQQVYADSDRLKKVLANLIANAIKYNRKGGNIEIKVSTENSETVTIAVSDTGIGFNAEQAKKIFQPFVRIDNESTNIDGVGIGLTICKQLVEAMNGSVGAESTPNVGSKFWIELKSANASVQAGHP